MTLKLRYESKLVTRDLAEKLLSDLNQGNRDLKEAHVWTIGEDMASGVFTLNPQPIVIREDSKKAAVQLLDGQHRLTAAARKAPKEGVAMQFCFASGNDTDIRTLQNTIDSGRPRSVRDRGGFQGLGIPQGLLEKSTRLFEIIGQAIVPTDPTQGVYGWIDAPKASYSACKLFASGQAAELARADQKAAEHMRNQFKGHRVGKQYLALAYLVALMNGASIDSLDDFANEAADHKSVLSCKLQEVWREGNAFSERIANGSRNSSGIQFLLMRDLLISFLNQELTSEFLPVLNITQVDGTTLTDFDVN